MTTTNRFAPPKAVLEDRLDTEGSLWRDGKVVVLRKGSDFPDRCIKCNQPSVAPKRRYKLTWHPPGWYVLILFALLLYAIVAIIVRKKAVVNLGLCEQHQRRVLWGRIIGWGGFAALVSMLVLGSTTSHGGFVGAAFLLLLPWALAAIYVNRLVLPQRIDDQYVRLKGCGPAFLSSLENRSWR